VSAAVSAAGARPRSALPVLRGARVTLRQLRQSDAAALMSHLRDPEVHQYVVGTPHTLHEFRRFIRWSHAQRRARAHLTFGMVPAGARGAVGIVQIWPIGHGFDTAEWGFVVGRHFWGSGLFAESAALLLDFAFQRLGVRRLEARTVDGDRRGRAVLRKLGATAEGKLRSAFRSRDVVLDHVMWSILSTEWTPSRMADGGRSR
jgi:RimJ/RimL family protein N-acetyltransferase